MADRTTEKPRAKRSWPRRVARVVGIVVASLVALVVVLVLWLTSSWGEGTLRGVIVSRLGEKVRGTVKLDALELGLGGELELRGLVLSDEFGREVVALDRLAIDVAAKELRGDRIPLESVQLSGLRVYLEQYEDGSSNLKNLFITSDEPKPDAPKKRRRIEVRSLAIDGVSAEVHKPDGTVIAVSDLGLDAKLDLTPLDKTFGVDVSRLGLGLTLEKPDGLRLAVSKLSTGLAADIVEGKGTATLRPTSADIELARSGQKVQELSISLGQIEVKIGDDGIEGALDKLLAGALALDQLRIKGRVVDGALVGDQRVDLAGLKVKADEVNALLGKEVLASDVDVALELSGPPGQLALATTIQTDGGVIRLGGKADVTDPQAPGYDLELKLTDISTKKLLGAGLDKVPPIESKSITVAVKGQGRDKEALVADVNLKVEKTDVRNVTIDRVEIAAKIDHGEVTVSKGEIEALGQKVELSGRYTLATKKAHAEISLSGDVGEALAQLRERGVPVKTQLPKGAVRLREGDLRITADGDVAGVLAVDVDAPGLALAGGTVAVRAHADLERNPPDQPDKKIALRYIDAHIRIDGLRIEQVMAIRGKSLPDLSATARGTIDVVGTLQDPKVDAKLQVRAHRTDALDPGQERHDLVADLEAHVVRTRADVDLTLSRTGPSSGATVLDLDARLPLYITDTHRGLAPGGPLVVDVRMPDRKIAEIVELLPRRFTEGRKIPPAEMGLDVHLEGSPAAPRGTLAVRAEATALGGGKTQKLDVKGDLATRDGHAVIAAHIDGWIDEDKPTALVATAEVDLSRSPLLPGPKEIAWKADLELTPQRISELPIESDKLKDVDGVARAKIVLTGTKTDVLGDVRVQIDDASKGKIRPLAVDLHAVVGETATQVDLTTKLDGTDAVLVRGDVGVPGRGLIPFIKEKKVAQAPLGVDLTIARRPLASLEKIRPNLKDASGDLAGLVKVTGTVGRPLAKGAITHDNYRTVSGEDGRADIELDVTDTELRASIGIGPGGAGAAPSPVMIDALVSRAELDTYRAEPTATLSIAAAARAEAVDIRRLVPEQSVAKKNLRFEGQLDWTMDAKVVLEKTPEKKGMREGTALGDLTLTRGTIVLPGSKRHYDDVEIRLTAGADALEIARISARESDLEKKGRQLDAHGKLAWENLRPKKVSLQLDTKDWLVFGGTLGMVDAPRGSVTVAARIEGDLEKPVKKVDVHVDALDLYVPDRFERAHQPEETSVGDMYFVGAEGAPAVGKLPLPESLQKKLEADKLAAEPKDEPEVPVDPTAPPPPETGIDLAVHLPARAHILQSPLNLYATGGVNVKVRGPTREIRGRVNMVGGSLSLGGQEHPLRRGHIAFDEECPKGCMDLFFAKKLKETTLRDVSLAGSGDEITIHMTGPLNDRKTVLGGAASPGTLFDLLSVHNAGRARYVSEPDLPATMTAQYPQHDNLLLLSYLGVNLPHMLFMDRVAAWSDPYDAPQSYGRVQHAELEAYNEDRDRRVRIINRPPEAGASQSEVQVDWLFSEPTDRSQFGVGVEAGSRLGGGPGVFYEWSSAD